MPASNPYHDSWQQFKVAAAKIGCTQKVYGDEAFASPRRIKGTGKFRYCKLTAAVNGEIKFSVTMVDTY